MELRDAGGRRRSACIGIALALLLALFVLANPAGAKKTKVPSTVEVIAATPSFTDPDKAFVLGTVSADRRCIANRKVVVTAVRDDATRAKLGTARTSENGAWAVDGSIEEFIGESDFDYAIAKVKKRVIKLSKRNKRVCGADTSQSPIV